MQTVIIVVHLMIVSVLIGTVLLQKSEGGGLGMGGGAGFMSSRGTANLLTRTTAILAFFFFVTSLWLAWIAGLTTCAVIGALIHLLVMRPLRRASPLARIVATLGILIILQSAAVLRYGATVTVVSSELPRDLVKVFGQNISVDRFILFGTYPPIGSWALV